MKPPGDEFGRRRHCVMCRWRRPAWLAAMFPICFAIVIGMAHALPESAPERIALKITLGDQGAVHLEKTGDASFRYVVVGAEGERTLSADEFAAALYRDQTERPLWKRVLNVTSPIGIAWVTLGFLGQLLFTGRMLVQWIASERRRQSVVPVMFWWMSLGGASMLLVYFVWRKDIVGVLGQLTGWVVYTRNLYFIYKERARVGAGP